MADDAVVDVHETSCAVVGGGPGGAMLALLLARRGVPVTLLEAHRDFDRDFRGDTIHPSVLRILDEIGLLDGLMQLPHGKQRGVTFQTADGPVRMLDFSDLKVRFPYIVMMPQARFLEFITAEAKRYPSFRLILGASVQRLIEEGGAVRGVRYRSDDGWYELRALLTVGADGRFSKVRHLAGLRAVPSGEPPMDVLWFRLPKEPGDPQDSATGALGQGRGLAMLSRATDWQIAFIFPKGGYQRLRAAGLEALRRSIVELVPWLAGRVNQLRDWHQLALLSTEASCCRRWYRPGLLLIGDAAHVMSPAGGVGINSAVQDAVAAANLLTDPLLRGAVRVRDLAAVQRRRAPVTHLVQTLQAFGPRRFITPRGLLTGGPARLPWPFRLALRVPFLRLLPGWLMFKFLSLGAEHVQGIDFPKGGRASYNSVGSAVPMAAAKQAR
jgi:2-polyprenyl-6-methoxyphenol hydroxylase-like FAD-dependent oxidoreductase